MPRRWPALVAVACALAALGGCEPTCRGTCRKLMSCEEFEAPRQSIDECEEQCELQENLYDEQWTDTALEEAFADVKRCIKDEECAAIEKGVCYDEDLWVW